MIRRNGYLCEFGYVGWPSPRLDDDGVKQRHITGEVRAATLTYYCEPIQWRDRADEGRRIFERIGSAKSVREALRQGNASTL